MSTPGYNQNRTAPEWSYVTWKLTVSRYLNLDYVYETLLLYFKSRAAEEARLLKEEALRLISYCLAPEDFFFSFPAVTISSSVVTATILRLDCLKFEHVLARRYFGGKRGEIEGSWDT